MPDASPKPLDMATMQALFEVTDDLGISRESIQVPLLPEGEGTIRILANERIEIVVPAERRLEDWLPELRLRLTSMLRSE